MKKLWMRLCQMHGRKELSAEHLSFGQLTIKRFCRDRWAVFGCIVILAVLCIVLAAPVICEYKPETIDKSMIRKAPGEGHILGTDDYGRDVFSRLVYGGRVSMAVAVCATALQLFFGIVLGSFAGYFGKWVDSFIMRVADVFMCFPFYIIAVCLAAILGPGLRNTIIILGFLGWPSLCRMVRAEILSIKENDFIMAAKSLGLSSGEIMFRHILPNVISPIIVSATLSVAGAIMSEASLSFLNLGVKIPQPSWGNMLSSAQSMNTLINEWWRWVPPGLCIIIVILSINYIGEGLRKAMTPKAGE
ncbi:oligopeptide ABC transporter permease [Lachnospiraceae bacterium 56-18]|jgi:peptide/nickel transport system permease protein|uniref:oligopeptide ABC transporter permease n=1 Tax=Sporofaciens sp. JLR.KK001 TaxID=3112621 RepID=UPI002FF3C1B0